MSDIRSAFLNTPVQPGTTILVKPPPECEQDDSILWKLSKNTTDFVTHHRSSNNIYQQYSDNLVYDNYGQINVSTTTTTSP
eukprot:2163513-Amphidinium_carterae.1